MCWAAMHCSHAGGLPLGRVVGSTQSADESDEAKVFQKYAVKELFKTLKAPWNQDNYAGGSSS